MEKSLITIDGESLMNLDLPMPKFCIKGLLPQGLSILGGAPKIGKSWLVMDLCVRVAKGEPMWNMEITQGTALYLCLEDTYARIQQRLGCITDEVPGTVFFSNSPCSLADGLESQITDFCKEHPDTVLIVIDTFQMIRSNSNEPSYGGDYEELQKLKRLADDLRISILLVHHLRKQGDRDPMNRLSGTTGITGAADAVFVLEKDDRRQSGARLICTGRDVEDRELGLQFNKETCTWDLISDSLDAPENLLPQEMVSFIAFMKDTVSFSGSNTEFTDRFNEHAGLSLAPKSLKQMMNRWRNELREQGVIFRSYRSNSQWLVQVSFSSASDSSDVSDE